MERTKKETERKGIKKEMEEKEYSQHVVTYFFWYPLWEKRKIDFSSPIIDLSSPITDLSSPITMFIYTDSMNCQKMGILCGKYVNIARGKRHHPKISRGEGKHSIFSKDILPSAGYAKAEKKYNNLLKSNCFRVNGPGRKLMKRRQSTSPTSTLSKTPKIPRDREAWQRRRHLVLNAAIFWIHVVSHFVDLLANILHHVFVRSISKLY